MEARANHKRVASKELLNSSIQSAKIPPSNSFMSHNKLRMKNSDQEKTVVVEFLDDVEDFERFN
jgi:hypothetical protein